MDPNFADVVEGIKKMSQQDKEDLKFLLDKYLIEEKREGIYRNYQQAKRELHDEKLKFSSNINELKYLIKK